MPGLTQKPFFDTEDTKLFPFVKDLEDNVGYIRNEYVALRRAYRENNRDDYERINGEELLDQTEKKDEKEE